MGFLLTMKIVLATYLFLGGVGIIAGAFGAHALEGVLSPEYLKTFETAVRYQMYQVLAGILFFILYKNFQKNLVKISMILNLFGIIIFSGTLYTLVFSGIKILGAFTPIGGFLFIVSWILAGISILKTNLKG